MERLLALAMTLLYRRTATVPTLAARFCVSERTIFRDLGLLDAAGLPLVSSPGRGGGIGLAKGFRLERQLFSENALGVWSDSLRALSELAGDEALGADADLAEGLLPDRPDSPSAIEVRWDHTATESVKPFLRSAASAIRDAIVLEVDYRDRNGSISRRAIEPLRLVHSGGTWYLQAWCRMRSDYRLFRTPRVRSWSVGQIPFDRMARLRDLPAFDPFDTSRHIPIVRLAVTDPSSDLLAYLGDPPQISGQDGRIELEIRWPVDGWLERWLCGQAPEVTVLEPEDLRCRVAQRLEAAARAYEAPQSKP
jgi:predicted DNA-binding transcriptional regulator YafY